MLDRKSPPPFNNSTSFQLLPATVKSFRTSLPFHFINGGDQEVIRVEFIFNSGRWMDKIWGTSHFTSALLTKGTTKRSSFDIAQAFDQYGAHIEVTPGLDAVTVSIYSLVKNLRPVLDTFIEVLTQATFPDKELRQNKSIFLQNLKVNLEKTSFVASSLIRKTLFGENHPYGKELEERDVALIERDQLLSFYADRFKPIYAFVSGKVDNATEKMIEEVFSNLQPGSNESPVYDSIKSSVVAQYVEKDGASQTSIRLGKRSLQRSHPDYADVLFLNHILGGYFGSRLMKNIREEKGLSYGIYSALHALQHDGYIVIGADVNKDNRVLAIQEIRNEVRRLSIEPVSNHELTTAKLHFIGSLQAELTTPFAHADKLKNIVLNNLSLSYYSDLINRINTVKPEELMTIAQKYFSEDSLSEVSVG